MSAEKSGRRRGSALIASLMVVLVVAGLGVAMVQVHSAVTRKQVRAIDTKRAFYVAEAGLSEAFMALSYGKSGIVADEDVPARFGDGVYWVEATELADGTVALISNGLCGSGRFSLAVVVATEVSPMTELGAFSGRTLTVHEGCVVDGYDSSLGTYAEQLPPGEGDMGGGARIHSNSDVVLFGDRPGSAATVQGDVHPGPDGQALMGSAVLVTGSTAPVESAAPLPAIEVPQLESHGDLLIDDPDRPLVLARQEVAYDRLTIAAGATARLDGPLILRVAELIAQPGSTLVLDTVAGPITVICTDSIALHEGSKVSCPGQDPTSLALLIDAHEPEQGDGDGAGGDGQPVRIEASGDFYGFLYAPHATLVLPASLRFFGALAADRVVLASGARVSIDRARATARTGLEHLPELVAWHIVSLPDTPLVKLRLDPLGQLALQGITPLETSLAHKERNINIKYFDTTGILRLFTGAEADFDWSAVGVLVAVDWS